MQIWRGLWLQDSGMSMGVGGEMKCKWAGGPFLFILEPCQRRLLRAEGKDSLGGGNWCGGSHTLMLVTVMTLGEDGANESGSVNWGGCSAAGCDCF